MSDIQQIQIVRNAVKGNILSAVIDEGEVEVYSLCLIPTVLKLKSEKNDLLVDYQNTEQ